MLLKRGSEAVRIVDRAEAPRETYEDPDAELRARRSDALKAYYEGLTAHHGRRIMRKRSPAAMAEIRGGGISPPNFWPL